jgi:hypothetical protein
MTTTDELHDSQDQHEQIPHRMRLPGFLSDSEEIGLGDVEPISKLKYDTLLAS